MILKHGTGVLLHGTLADYAPRTARAAQPTGPAAGTPEADALIDDDADDLPF